MKYCKRAASEIRPANPAKAVLLCGVSVIAWGIVVGRPTPANAQTVTGNSPAIITQNDVNLYIDRNVNVTGVDAVSNATSITVPVISSQGTLTGSTDAIYNDISGTIGAVINGGYGIMSGATAILSHGVIGTVTNNGMLTGTSDGIDNYYDAGVSIGVIANSGVIAGGYAGVENFNQIGFLDNSEGGISGDSQAGIYNATSSSESIVAIATLTNSGQISSSAGFGIWNDNATDTIGTLTNVSGASITAVHTAIENGGTIGMLANSGVISSTDYAIQNESGASIGAVTNLAGGTIIGTGGASAIVNAGTITAFTNGGFLATTGGDEAIYNNHGTIGVLTNLAGGTIQGASGAIYNTGVIGALTNGGLISAADSYGIDNDGSSIGALTNLAGGTIAAHYSAIYNVANLGTLTNAGVLISINDAGIYNDETIDTLTNTGTISSSASGIYNQDGTINTFTNTGVISSTGDAGFGNYGGTVGTLTNSGVISATGYDGIYNDSTIGTLTNLAGGTIIGSKTAIYNVGGTINALTNGGVIISTGYGIDNYDGASIGVLTNLAGATIAAAYSAILNYDGIDTLTNSGLLSGEYGIDNDGGSIGTLTSNAGATIAAQQTGIYNAGTIGTLTNGGLIFTGTITSDEITPYGIYNVDAATIGTLTNLAGGTIAAYITGIGNEGSTINVLTNGGVITSAADYGIYNDNSTIGTLTNLAGGTILSYDTGIDNNAGVINVLTNGGVIISTADDEGVTNDGTIGVLTNLAGGTIAGDYSGMYNDGTIGVLTNGGVISGPSQFGITNDAGSIGTLTNLAGGTIAGSYTGIWNENGTISTLINGGVISSAIDTGVENYGGSITVLTNLAGGTISGGTTGVYNNTSIAALTNAGLISGLADAGITNDTGTIAALTNLAGGTISGATAGLYNNNAIPTLSNAGLITGGAIGFDNASDGNTSDGIVTALTNTGTISGGNTGIYNAGSITTISSSGIISGSIAGIFNATIGGQPVVNGPGPVPVRDAYIGSISNTGTITGLTGIYLTGGGTDIFNAGTIASTDGGNAIFFGGLGNLTLTTGSDIIGTIAATGTANQITLEGSSALDSDIAGFGPGSALAVTPGADWTGTGNWNIASVTNDGVFQAGRLGTPLNVTGDYLQNADGTLQVLVTPTQSTQLNVAGTATLAGGVTYLLPPGHYVPHVYPYLTAAVINGGFTTISYGDIPTGFATTEMLGDPTVNFVISRAFYLPNIVNPTGTAIFSAQSQALAQSADADTTSLLNKATLGGAVSSPACGAESSLTPDQMSTNGVSKTAHMASTLANVFCGAGGWIQATGSLNHVSNSGGAAAYDANTGGFLAGIDHVMNTLGTRIGVAFGYGRTTLTDKSGGGGAMDTVRVALYGAQPIGPFALAGVLAYGNASDTTSRATAIGNLAGSNHESIFSGGAQLSTMVTLQNIDFEPAAGLRIARVDGGRNFTESATGLAAAYAITGKTPSYTSIQPFLLLSASKSFVTAAGITVTPNAQIGLEYEAGDRGVSTQLATANGFAVSSPHNELDPEDALISLGITAGRNNWSLFATYTGRLSGNWNSQSADAGVRVRF